jgi:hypothetical protein
VFCNSGSTAVICFENYSFSAVIVFCSLLSVLLDSYICRVIYVAKFYVWFNSNTMITFLG